MTRIYTDGAEMNDVLFFDFSTNVSVATAASYASPYYYASIGYAYKSISALTECYTRIRVKVTSPVAAIWAFPAFYSDTTPLAMLGIDALGHWNAYTYIGWWSSIEDSGVVMNQSQWYLVEIYFKLADAPDGRFVVYVDGTKIIDFTGDTKTQTPSTFNRINYYRGNDGGYYYFDDIALNDTSNADGKNDNSWCGDGIVIKITPNEDGAHNNWDGSDGDKIDNYLLVDEYPDDGDTTYVSATGSSSGTQDQYSMSDYDGTGKTVLRVYAEARARKTVSDASRIKIGLLPSGSTDQMSSAKDLVTGDYLRVAGDEYKVNPADSGAWEEADIDALEGVIEVA